MFQVVKLFRWVRGWCNPVYVGRKQSQTTTVNRDIKVWERWVLRNTYRPKFKLSSFSLCKPKLDGHMKRRLKGLRSFDASRAQTREKNLMNIQEKVFGIINPLAFLMGAACTQSENVSFTRNAVVAVMKQCGHCFPDLKTGLQIEIPPTCLAKVSWTS